MRRAVGRLAQLRARELTPGPELEPLGFRRLLQLFVQPHDVGTVRSARRVAREYGVMRVPGNQNRPLVIAGLDHLPLRPLVHRDVVLVTKVDVFRRRGRDEFMRTLQRAPHPPDPHAAEPRPAVAQQRPLVTVRDEQQPERLPIVMHRHPQPFADLEVGEMLVDRCRVAPV